MRMCFRVDMFASLSPDNNRGPTLQFLVNMINVKKPLEEYIVQVCDATAAPLKVNCLVQKRTIV